jgi:hypothetical protein
MLINLKLGHRCPVSLFSFWRQFENTLVTNWFSLNDVRAETAVISDVDKDAT